MDTGRNRVTVTKYTKAQVVEAYLRVQAGERLADVAESVGMKPTAVQSVVSRRSRRADTEDLGPIGRRKPGCPPRITPEMREAIVRRYRETRSPSTVVAEFGVSQMTVYRLFRESELDVEEDLA